MRFWEVIVPDDPIEFVQDVESGVVGALLFKVGERVLPIIGRVTFPLVRKLLRGMRTAWRRRGSIRSALGSVVMSRTSVAAFCMVAFSSIAVAPQMSSDSDLAAPYASPQCSELHLDDPDSSCF